jgi:translation initiation factor 2 subunit 2
MVDYDALLNRGKAGEHAPQGSSRFHVPPAKLQAQGKKTVIVNFIAICDTISRDPSAVATFMSHELGTAASQSDTRLALSGSFTAGQVNGAIKKYVDEHVICKVCHLPDTKLITEGRQTFIRCEACGAKYPLR